MSEPVIRGAPGRCPMCGKRDPFREGAWRFCTDAWHDRVIPEALPEELIEHVAELHHGDRTHVQQLLTEALAWRDSDGSPYLYTRDQLEQVGWLHTRAGGLVAYRQDTTADEHIWTLANGWVAVYRLRENPDA